MVLPKTPGSKERSSLKPSMGTRNLQKCNQDSVSKNLVALESEIQSVCPEVMPCLHAKNFGEPTPKILKMGDKYRKLRPKANFRLACK